MDISLTAGSAEENKGNGFRFKISNILENSLLYLIDKTINLRKVAESIDEVTEEIKDLTGEIDRMSIEDIREIYVDLADFKDTLKPFNEAIGIAKSETKQMRQNIGKMVSSLEEFIHFSLVLIHKLESQLSRMEVNENSDDYNNFLGELTELSEKNIVTGSGADVNELFK